MSLSQAAYNPHALSSELVTSKRDETLAVPFATYRLWYQRGKLLAHRGHYEAALLSFDTALTIQQNEHRIWVFRGVVLAHLKHYELALASFNKAIEIACDDRQAWTFRGAVLTYLNRQREARHSYAIALSIQQKGPNEEYPMWVPPRERRGLHVGQ